MATAVSPGAGAQEAVVTEAAATVVVEKATVAVATEAATEAMREAAAAAVVRLSEPQEGSRAAVSTAG